MSTLNMHGAVSGSTSDGWRTNSPAAARGLLWRLARARAVGIQTGPFIGALIGLAMWGAAIALTAMWLMV